MGNSLSINCQVDQLAETAEDSEIAEKLQLEELLNWTAAVAAAEQPEEPSSAFDLYDGRARDPVVLEQTPEGFDPYIGETNPAMDRYAQPLPSAPPLIEETYCAVCKEVKHPDEFVSVKPCAHQFCSSCVSQYLLVKLDESVNPIGCPEPGCKRGTLDPGDCKDLLPRDTFERWCRSLCESMVGAKLYCPYSDCHGLLEGGGEDELVVLTDCPHCERQFCAQCMVPWHDGVDCEDVRRPGEDERARGHVTTSSLDPSPIPLTTTKTGKAH